MTLAADIETVLRQHLPADHHGAVTALALVLADAAIGMVSPAQAQARLSALDLASAVRALAGHEIRAGSTLLSFGAGSQIGDVSIGDVAGGSITKLSLSVGVIQHVSVSGQGRVGDVIGVQNNYNYYTSPSPADRVQRLAVARSRHSQERFAELRQGFVGRRAELTGIAAEIDALRTTGGYLLITGVAGQGKSGVLAALTAELGAETTPAYFIRFSPGADEQVALLRHLVAELLIQHGLEELADSYLPETAGTITLANSLAMVLDRVSAAGQQAILVIDGLDQIRPDRQMGERDLSFLPEKLPAGVVIVIGTRPDDTLKPLRVLASQREYKLPRLSQDDFGALLDQRGAALAAHDRQALYEALHGNAFDLAFIARELASTAAADVPALLERVRRNPQDIFAPALDRLRGDQNTWRRAIRPILGCLLAATGSEPLSEDALGVVVGLDTDEVSGGLLRLRGFLGETDRGGRAYYYLYHLRLIDYLKGAQVTAGTRIFSARDIEQWRGKLASWCEGGTGGINTIWQDTLGDTLEQERRTYARQHYIAHLAAAHSYERLWGVIDAGEYGAAKRRFDPSTRSYALDLDIACQSLIDATVGDMEAQARSLPRLWRYRLLRCSLTSQADSYRKEHFLTLITLGRRQEAVQLAELLSEAATKATILRAIGVATLAYSLDEGLSVLYRAHAVANAIADRGPRTTALSALAAALAQAGQAAAAAAVFADARTTIATIQPPQTRANALGALAEALAQAGQSAAAAAVFADAHAAAKAILNNQQRAILQGWLTMAQHRANQGTTARATPDGTAPVQTRPHQNEPYPAPPAPLAVTRAATASISHAQGYAQNLCILALALTHADQHATAASAFAIARTIADSIPEELLRTNTLHTLALALIQAGLFDPACAAADVIPDSGMRSDALRSLVEALARAGLFDRAQALIDAIPDAASRTGARSTLARELAQAGLFDRAQAVADMLPEGGPRTDAVRMLVQALAQAGQFDRARATADTIQNSQARPDALYILTRALAEAGQFDRARTTAAAIFNTKKRVAAWSARAQALAQASQHSAAEAIFTDCHAAAKKLPNGPPYGWARAEALTTLAQTLGKFYQYQVAKEVCDDARAAIDKISDVWKRASALDTLAQALVWAHQYNDACATAAAIVDAKERARTFTTLGQTLVQAGQLAVAETAFAAARTAIDAIPDPRVQAEALIDLARAQAQVNQRAEAEKVFADAQAAGHKLQKGQGRAATLCALAQTLAAVGYQMAFINLCQDLWRRAHTRDELLSLFAIDAALLRAYPELGQEFLDSFAWVDTQLTAV